MASPGCSLILASNVADSFSDSHVGDILLVATDCAMTGALLVGFATTTGSTPVASSIRVDGASVSFSGNVITQGFSNVSGCTYASNLAVAGAASVGGGLTIGAGLFAPSFSNVANQTYCSSLCAVNATVSGTLDVHNDIHAAQFSNVLGVTYTSNIFNTGASTFLGPLSVFGDILGDSFSNVAGATFIDSLSANSINSSNATFSGPVCVTTTLSNTGTTVLHGTVAVGSNVSIASGLVVSGSTALSSVTCVGPLTVSGSILGGSFSNVGETTYSCTHSNAGNTAVNGTLFVEGGLSNVGPMYAYCFSNVAGVTYASNIVGATLSGCSVPFVSLTGLPAPTWTVAGSNTFITQSNVGIGLTSPAYPLDVAGNVRFSSNVLCTGLSNVGGVTYASSLIGGSATFSGPVAAPAGLYASSFSNVAGAVYASNIIGASLTSCSVPYNSITGVPAPTWTASGATTYITQSNVGIGLTNPAYPLDVLGSARVSSNVYCTALSNVGGITFVGALQGVTASFSGTLTTPAGLYASSFSNVNGAVYASNIVGATLTNCIVPYTCITAAPQPSNIYLPGFSNVLGGTYASNIYLPGFSNVLGGTYASNIFLPGFSNVLGVTYASNIVSATFTSCSVPFSSLTGVPAPPVPPAPAWTSSGTSLFILDSNIGIGLSSPVYPLDVVGTARFSAGLLLPGLSNTGNTTFVSNLGAVAGSFSGPLSALSGLYAQSFSNVNGAVYASNIVGANLTACAVPYSSLTGAPPPYVLPLSSNLYLPGFSNVLGVTYASNIAGATFTNCIFPGNFASSSSSSGWIVSGRNLCVGATSNVGLGVLSPACALDVAGDIHASGTMYANGFTMVAGSGSGSGSGTSWNGGNSAISSCNTLVASNLYLPGFSNVQGVTYASNIVGATLTNCVFPASTWSSSGSNVFLGVTSNVGIGVSMPVYALDVLGDFHATGAVYADAFIMTPGSASASRYNTPGAASNIYLPGFSNVGGVTYASNIVGATLTNCTLISASATSDVTRLGLIRNRVINGDMCIDQRFSGASQLLTNVAGTYIADRMVVDVVGAAGSVTAQQTSSPAGPGQGLTNSMALSVTTANATPAPNDFVCLSHRIEGSYLADLGWGTANASSVVVSFWIYSSVTGTFAVSLRNGSVATATRSVVSTFTVGPINTWYRAVAIFAGDQSGVWNTGAVLGAVLSIAMTCGSSLASPSAVAGHWQAGCYIGAQGQANLMGTAGAQVNITGIQFERGMSVTPFETRPYWFELQMCQRYFHLIRGSWQSLLSVGYGGYQGTSCITLPVPQRLLPTLAYGGSAPNAYGVSEYGLGFLYPFSGLVLSPTNSTRDIVLNPSWTATSGAPVLSAGMTLTTTFNSGAWLSFSSEL